MVKNLNKGLHTTILPAEWLHSHDCQPLSYEFGNLANGMHALSRMVIYMKCGHPQCLWQKFPTVTMAMGCIEKLCMTRH